MDGTAKGAVKPPYADGHGYAFHRADDKWSYLAGKVAEATLPLGHVLLHTDMASQFKFRPHNGKQSQEEYRNGRGLALQTATTARRGHVAGFQGSDLDLAHEEFHSMSDVRVQNSGLIESGVRNILSDLKSRDHLRDDHGGSAALHKTTDNCAVENKCRASTRDYANRCMGTAEYIEAAVCPGSGDEPVQSEPRKKSRKRKADSEPAREPAMPFSTCRYGPPNHGKDYVDAAGGRKKRKMNLVRANDSLPDPEDAASAVAIMNQPDIAAAATLAAYGQGKSKRVARFSRDRCMETTAAAIKAVEGNRGNGIEVPGILRAREIVFCPDTKRIGWRPLWCACAPCIRKEWAKCKAAHFVPQPVWVSQWGHEAREWVPIKEAEGIPDVEAEELEEEMDSGIASALGPDVVVAVENRSASAEWDDFDYFLFEISSTEPETLLKGETDGLGYKFKKGDEVLRGKHLGKPDDSEGEAGTFGPGRYAAEPATVMVKMKHIIGLDWDVLPVRAHAVKLTPHEDTGGDEWMELSAEEHARILASIRGRTVLAGPVGGGTSRAGRQRRAPKSKDV